MSPGQRFLVVSCRLERGGEELLGEALLDLPTLGCEIVPEEGDTSEARIYFDPWKRGAVALLRERLASSNATAIVVGELEAEDWLRSFRKHAVAFPVGKLWWVDPKIQPEDVPPPERIRLAVEPRMAFGSGTHETTRLALMALESLSVSGKSVLDVGTGSGILSLASFVLGAGPVVGLDIDRLAVFEARRTASEQDFDSRVLFLAGPAGAIDSGRRFDLVLCNMIWESMRPLLPRIFRAVAAEGEAVLSGLLRVQEEAVVEELHGLGFAATARRELGEWLGLVVQRG